jgi:type I restriction enzyme, S subunit
MQSDTDWMLLDDVVEDIIDRRGVTPLKLGGDFCKSGHRLISARVVKDGRVQLEADEPRYVNSVIYRRWMRTPLRKGDVVMTSEAPLGELAYLHCDVDWVLGQRLFAIRPDAKKLDGRFLYYALRTSRVRDDILGRASGTTVQGIRQAELRRVRVPVPAMTVQLEAAATLGALDDRIDLLHQTNATLESISQTLFKSWFVDFEPVHAKQAGREPEAMGADTLALFPDSFEDSALGMIPKGWRRQPFGTLLASAIGGDWGCEKRDSENPQPVAVIRGTDMPDIRSGKYDNVPRRFVGRRKFEKRALVDGDIVIEVSGGSKTQPTGRSLYVTSAMLDKLGGHVVPTSFCRLFRAPDASMALLLGQHLTSIYEAGKTWNYQVQSTGLANFQTQHFLDAEMVVVPPPEVCAAFFQVVRPLVNRMHAAPISELSQLRDTLLPRLITGQLPLPEMRAQLEEALA